MVTGRVPPFRTIARTIASGVYRRLRGRFKDHAIRLSERIVGRQAVIGRVAGVAGSRYSLQIPGLLGPYVVARSRLRLAGWVLDLATGAPLPWRVRLGRRAVPATVESRPDLAAAFAGLCALPELCGGSVDLPVRPGPSLLVVEVETSPGGPWRPLYRAVVLGVGRLGGDWDPDSCFRYPLWRQRERAIARAEAEALPAPDAPTITVLIIGEDEAAARETLASLEEQRAGGWTPVRVGRGDVAAALSAAEGTFTLPLEAGDQLLPGALSRLRGAATARPEADLIYADQEGGAGAEPFFKPAWSPDTLEAFDYVGAPALYRTAIARHLGARSPYDLALRFTERTESVFHLEAVLCRRRRAATEASGWDDRAALADRLARTGRHGTIEPLAPGLSCLVATVAPPSPPPLVSIVMPTAGRDLEIHGRHLDLVIDCVRSIRERSTYRQLEFVIVANTDLPESKREALEGLGCRVVTFEEPVFNVAKKLNLGVRHATGAFLLLMNDDIEIVAADWIERLLAQASKPHVGVVGGKLLYPDGTLQHAGVVLMRGNPDHVRRFYPREDRGIAFSTGAPRNYLAVTGACMMSRAENFRAVGGYTEALSVCFNDVDYCLKLRELGLHTVYEPGCELTHFESVSRAPRIDPAELDYFMARWGGETAADPFYNTLAFGTVPASFETCTRMDGGRAAGELVGPPRASLPRATMQTLSGSPRGGRIAVLYLVRGADEGHVAACERFIGSYEAQGAGRAHDLVLVCKGFAARGEIADVERRFARHAPCLLEVADDSFDLGAYRDAARLIDHDLICCLNTNSEIQSGGWLDKLARNLERDGVGLVGATGSYEPLAHDSRFGGFPNVHLRSNGFLIARTEFLSVAGDARIREKNDAYLLESGPESLTRRMLANGRAVLVVGADGRGYPPRFWPRSGTFRLGRQSNLLIGDNQTRTFAGYAWPERASVARRTWGRFLAELPADDVGRPER